MISDNAGELKTKILEMIQEKVPVFKQSSNGQYRIRCPICGDSQKNFTDSHLYLKCSYDPTEPILYKCFKCNASGKVTNHFLSLLGIDIPNFDDDSSKYFNRINKFGESTSEILTGSPNMKSDQVGYIEYRLGKGLTEKDFSKFKIVWDMNQMVPYASTQRVKNTLPSNMTSISFLSTDGSMLLTRFFQPRNEIRWKKTKLFPSNQRSFYTIAASIELLTSETITVNIAEGVIDVISIYKNFNTGDNSLYLATLAKDYKAGIEYVISLGLLGSNVNVKVYVDSDVDQRLLNQDLRRYKWFFGNITTFRNSKNEDFGVPIDQIVPIERRI